MASFLSPKQTESYATEAVPQSLQSNDSPMAMKGKVSQVAVQCSTGNQNASGKLLFTLPSDPVSISRRSMFLKARISLNYTATLPALTSNTATTFVTLQGPGLGAGGLSAGQPALTKIGGAAQQPEVSQEVVGFLSGISTLSNAYSCIQRSTVYSGSKVIDDIDYVCDLMGGLILPHNTHSSWISGDGALLAAIACVPIPSTTLTTGGFMYWDICLPIIHSCFSSDIDFPNYLIDASNPISLEINLTPLNRAIKFGTSAVPSPLNYTFSNISLCYQTTHLPKEYIDSMRMRVKSNPFVIPQLSYMITQMPISQLANFNSGINMSSLRAVYILPTNSASYNTTLTYTPIGSTFQYSRGSANDFVTSIQATAVNFQGTNIQLFLDGSLVNKMNLDNPSATFAALKQALNGSITDYTKPFFYNRASYFYNHFAIGINTRNFSDESTIMSGTSASQAQIIMTNFALNATAGTYLANLIFAYDSLLIIKNGKVTTKR